MHTDALPAVVCWQYRIQYLLSWDSVHTRNNINHAPFGPYPTLQVAGNHEIELQPDNRTFTAYNTRYPQPQNPGSFQINTSAVPANVNGSDNNLYSAAVVPGIASVVSCTLFYNNTNMQQRVVGCMMQGQLSVLQQSLDANV